MKLNKFVYSFVLSILLFTSLAIAKDLQVLHEKNYTVKEFGDLEINTTSGDMYISTWNKNEIYVKISGNSKAEKLVEFAFENSDGNLKILADKENGNWSLFSNVYIKYEVKVPKNFNAYLKTAGGDIRFYDLNGTAEFHTSGGDIEIFNFTGKTEAKTSGGDITIVNTTGDIELKTSGGDIDLEIFDGRVEATTSGGDIQLKYSGENKGIDAKTSGGDIHLQLPENIKANIDLSTSGGDVDCELKLSKQIKKKSSQLKGEINGGGNTIKCKTSGGDIEVSAPL